MKTKSKLIIIITAVLFIQSAVAILPHDIHISYGESELTAKEFSGKITFYKNDFMMVLKNRNNGNLKNLSGEEFTSLKNAYLDENLKVYVNGKDLSKIIITGNSEDDNSIWFEFKFKFETPVQQIKIKYTVLFNEYGDQMNLLNIKTPAGEESRIFKSSESETTIIF